MLRQWLELHLRALNAGTRPMHAHACWHQTNTSPLFPHSPLIGSHEHALSTLHPRWVRTKYGVVPCTRLCSNSNRTGWPLHCFTADHSSYWQSYIVVCLPLSCFLADEHHGWWTGGTLYHVHENGSFNIGGIMAYIVHITTRTAGWRGWAPYSCCLLSCIRYMIVCI